MVRATFLLLAASAWLVKGAPQWPGQGGQVVLSASQSNLDRDPHPDWDPLEHSSGISPYHDAPGADIKPPEGCSVTAAAFLIRHSSIYANDDEWEEYMQPFAQRVKEAKGVFPSNSPLAFLNTWESPINEDNLEQLTKPGSDDAFALGKRFRKLYPHLLPPKKLGRKKRRRSSIGRWLDILKGSKKDKDRDTQYPFKVWTASSERDIGTAKAFVKGAFPKSQEGRRGEGDGKYLTLVEVPNKDPNWSASLTPHKVCPRFTKEEGRKDGRAFLEHWGPAPLEKLRRLAPDFPFELKDVIAIQMLCGYESVIKGVGQSEFCRADIFDAEDYRNYEYFHDLIYNKMVGYESPVAPYLGVHWLNTSTHNLLSAGRGEGDHPHPTTADQKDPHLPIPGGPPNSTHSQRLFAYFTHREEPPVALVSLGLWNQTEVGPMPLDHRVDNRVWRTSHVLPFLGHVALERLRCSGKKSSSDVNARASKSQDYIRAIVNGASQPLKNCQSGPGQTCPLEEFAAYVDDRMKQFGDFEGACRAEEA